MPAKKRTTHRSSAGKKLYAVRDSEGQFKDIQTYERASRADQKKKSEEEEAAERKTKRKATKKTAKKATRKASKKKGAKK